MLPETNLNEAKIVADRILAQFSLNPLTIDEIEITKFTLSIGIAEYRRNEGVEQFMHRADAIMYEAKKYKGNCVVLEPASEEMSVTNLKHISFTS